MDALAGVVFHVDARDADALVRAGHVDIDPAVLGQRLIVLRNLVALGQIRIEVILAGEDRAGVHRAVQRQRGLDGEFHSMAVQHRQRARQTQANRADIGIGRRSETGGAAAENLGSRGQLDVHFQADHRLVLCDDVRCGEGLGARRHLSIIAADFRRPRPIGGVFHHHKRSELAHSLRWW